MVYVINEGGQHVMLKALIYVFFQIPRGAPRMQGGKNAPPLNETLCMYDTQNSLFF